VGYHSVCVGEPSIRRTTVSFESFLPMLFFPQHHRPHDRGMIIETWPPTISASSCISITAYAEQASHQRVRSRGHQPFESVTISIRPPLLRIRCQRQTDHTGGFAHNLSTTCSRSKPHINERLPSLIAPYCFCYTS